jgi:hypothetical protein
MQANRAHFHQRYEGRSQFDGGRPNDDMGVGWSIAVMIYGMVLTRALRRDATLDV